MANELLNEALRYLKLGFSIIPVKDKICLLKSWKEFQTRKPAKDEIEKWFLELSPTGIAIITGAVSGVVVLDVEKGADLSEFVIPRTPTVETGGGGLHYYFKAPAERLPNRVRFLPNVDFRGEGGYAACPPSQHKSGGKYKWLIDFDRAPLANIPKWLIDKLKGQPQIKDWERILEGVPEGERHNTATSVIGKLFFHLPKEDWQSFAMPLINAWNEKNDPPMDDKELFQIARSLAAKEITSRKQKGVDKNGNIDKQENDNTINIDLSPVSLGELASREVEESRWTIKQLIPEASITMLSAPPATAKTWLALYFAIQVAQGEMVLEKFKTRQQKVLFLEEDSNDKLIIRRLKQLDPDKKTMVAFLIRKNIKLENEKTMAKLLEFSKKENIGLIIFDTFSQFHAQDENSNRDMVKIFAPLKKFTDEGISILLLHHHRKESKEDDNGLWKDYSQSARGASAITGMLNSHLIVQRLDKNKYVLRQTKLWEDEEMNPLEFAVIKEFDKTVIKFLGTKEPEKDRKTLTADTILENLKESNLTREQLVEKLKDIGSQSIVASMIAKLKKDHKIVVVEKTGPKGKTEVYGLFEEIETIPENQKNTENSAATNKKTSEEPVIEEDMEDDFYATL